RVWVDRNLALAPDDGLIVELLPLPAGGAPADTLVLAPAAARLRIRYLDAPGVWVDAWDAEEVGRLPLAIELRIATAPGPAVPQGEELVFAPELAVPIAEARRRRGADAGASPAAAASPCSPCSGCSWCWARSRRTSIRARLQTCASRRTRAPPPARVGP